VRERVIAIQNFIFKERNLLYVRSVIVNNFSCPASLATALRRTIESVSCGRTWLSYPAALADTAIFYN